MFSFNIQDYEFIRKTYSRLGVFTVRFGPVLTQKYNQTGK
jgi:hypothetical protein